MVASEGDLFRRQAVEFQPAGEVHQNSVPDAELIDSLRGPNREKFDRFAATFGTNFYIHTPQPAKGVLIFDGFSGDSKSRYAQQFRARWRHMYKELMDQVGTTDEPLTFTISGGRSVEYARQAHLITSPKGEITKEEYKQSGELTHDILRYGLDYLPDNSVFILEASIRTHFRHYPHLQSRLHSQSDARYNTEDIGVERWGSTAYKLARYGLYPSIFSIHASKALGDKTIEMREAIKDATPAEAVIIYRRAGNIDNLSGKEIKREASLSSNRGAREQQISAATEVIYRLSTDPSLRTPDWPSFPFIPTSVDSLEDYLKTNPNAWDTFMKALTKRQLTQIYGYDKFEDDGLAAMIDNQALETEMLADGAQKPPVIHGYTNKYYQLDILDALRSIQSGHRALQRFLRGNNLSRKPKQLERPDLW